MIVPLDLRLTRGGRLRCCLGSEVLRVEDGESEMAGWVLSSEAVAMYGNATG